MKYEAEESQNQCGNLYGSTEVLGQREPRNPCNSRQAVQETEIQGEGLGMTFRYAVNNYFNDENHWVCFPHWFGAFLYAVCIKSKVVRMNKEEWR